MNSILKERSSSSTVVSSLRIDRKKFEDMMKKAGKILIVSDMDVEKQEIYHL